MKRTRFALLLCCVAAGLVAVRPDAGSAATPTTPYEVSIMSAPEVQASSVFGDGLATAGDLNADGVNDFFAGQPNLDIGGVTDQGRVYAISGRDRTVIRAFDSPEPQAGAFFGFFFSAYGDADGDGRLDLAVGTDAQNVYTGSGPPCGAAEPNGCNERQGKAWAMSSATGRVLFAMDNPVPQGTTTNRARFGSRMGAAGDITGDGVGDIIVAGPYNDQPAGCGNASPIPIGCRVDEGQAFIFNGASGALIRTLNLPAEDRQPATCTASCGWFGLAVQGPGDTDGDQVPDQLVDAASYSVYTGTGTPCGDPEPNGCNETQGRMYLYSGRTGELIRRIDNPFPTRNTLFGFQDVAPNAPGDVTGDGNADLFASSSEEGLFQGQGYVFDGKTGAYLYALKMPDAEVGNNFFTMDKVDYNKDGTPDLVAGDLPVSSLPRDENGGVYVYDGRNGSLLKSFEMPAGEREPGRRVTTPANRGPFLGWSLIAPGDLNSDGEPDFVASGPQRDEGSTMDAGRLYAFLSAPGVGYRLVAGDGGIFAFGDAPFFGSTGNITLNRPVVGIAPTPNKGGYWMVASDGGVFAFGDARFVGSTGNIALNRPIVGMAATPTGRGYWLVASDGGVFAFGDARFVGSTGNIALNRPIVGMAATPSGRGYWLVASDGGIFAFGDARFLGSTGNITLNRPIVGMAATPSGRGYWLVASDGGIFAFGDAGFHGSTGAIRLAQPVVGMAGTPSGRGYWLVASDGGIFAFGDARFLGSMGAVRLNRPVVGMAAG